jgi:hypothetical protein
MTEDEAHALAAAIPASTLVTVPGTNHYTILVGETPRGEGRAAGVSRGWVSVSARAVRSRLVARWYAEAQYGGAGF